MQELSHIPACTGSDPVHILFYMPARNVVKQYGTEQYYHIYSRGVAKQPVFRDESDYLHFLSLFKRYLSAQPGQSKRHGPYPHYGMRLRLLAYCLMPNHVHLLIYQSDEKAMPEFVKALLTSYSMYFNYKYQRVGPVFQSRYKASRITADQYLEHISRYIHLNPRSWRSYQYSSLQYYLGEHSAEWLHRSSILQMFSNSPAKYLEFLQDYEGQKQILDDLKWELADS